MGKEASGKKRGGRRARVGFIKANRGLIEGWSRAGEQARVRDARRGFDRAIRCAKFGGATAELLG